MLLSVAEVINTHKAYITMRFDYDTTTTQLRRKIDVQFLLASNRVEWKQARAIRRSRIVVVSQSNRNCIHGLTQYLRQHHGHGCDVEAILRHTFIHSFID